MSPRILVTLIVILVIIVAGMAPSLKRSASTVHRGDPNDAAPAHAAPPPH
jgi:hypothetical protein